MLITIKTDSRQSARLVTGLLELAGSYLTAAARGCPAGGSILALSGLTGRAAVRAAGWLLVTFPAGTVAEVLLDLIYRQGR
jgi:hypothetical protein